MKPPTKEFFDKLAKMDSQENQGPINNALPFYFQYPQIKTVQGKPYAKEVFFLFVFNTKFVGEFLQGGKRRNLLIGYTSNLVQGMINSDLQIYPLNKYGVISLEY